MPASTSTTTTMATSHASSTSPTATLTIIRALYQRAVRAFLKRDTTETQSHIDAAFQLLTPPSFAYPDSLSSQRKKWDILRITLETTLYVSSASASHDADLDDVSRTSFSPSASPSSSLYNRAANLLLSPPSLLATLHTRSLCLFTPMNQAKQPSPAFLPPQILVSLVLASLKLNCPQVGRGMVEEWLARRPLPPPAFMSSGNVPNGKRTGEDGEDDGYAKVVDVYCLHVLPRLAEWEYAMEFLKHEVELPTDRRARIIESLKAQHLLGQQQESQTSRRSPSPERSSRSSSTLVSNVSEECKLSRSSSTSSFTAVPGTPKPHGKISSQYMTSMANGRTTPGDKSEGEGSRPSSRASTIKPSTANGTPPAIAAVNGKGKERLMKSQPTTNLYHVVNASSSSSSSATNPVANGTASTSPRPGSPSSSVRPMAPLHASEAFTRYLTVLQYQLSPFLQKFKTRLPFLVCVVLPLMAFLTRWRLRARRVGGGTGKGTVQDVKRRLGLPSGNNDIGILRRVYKMLEDTVVMAGRGLV
ncbi:hypothetical protein FRB95_010714 [Tulasnella sp. JGI-2019a]|nr:hypothetical protein FRB95_010714 [Tulasnella sp. JGI-2019a]